jgi:hypothetical protein
MCDWKPANGKLTRLAQLAGKRGMKQGSLHEIYHFFACCMHLVQFLHQVRGTINRPFSRAVDLALDGSCAPATLFPDASPAIDI